MARPNLLKGRVLASVLLCWLVSACTVVGPDFSPPETPPLPSQWGPEDAQQANAAVGAWWQLFDDPVLSQLIERGMQQNLSVEAAGLRIVQARAALGISDALVFPQQQQINANLAGLYRNEDWFKAANASFDVGWEMDIWGRYARGIEVSEATLYVSIASYHDVLVSISAEIARNYINYRTAEERSYLSQQNIQIQQRVLEMTQVQFDAGNVSELDVQQAKTQLFATQASLPDLDTARLQSMNAIAVLLGTIPENLHAVLSPSDQRQQAGLEARLMETQREDIDVQHYNRDSVIPNAPRLDSQVDSQLVLARPDLKVAELSARAQSARIGLTQADLYPQFFLFGSIGASQTVRSNRSFDLSDALTASIGPGMTWNVFEYDRIKNAVRIEDALFQESLTNYNLAVIEAVREVTNALQTYQNNVRRAELDFQAVSASIRAFNISANQYNNGLVSYQRLLSTVEQMTLREDIYAVTRGNIANQVVALYKALGGGWVAAAGNPIVKPEIVDQMRKRTDWGDYLEQPKLEGKDRDE
ncbi:MAG: TolC family protein [Pseudomonadota bacterium]